MKVYVYQEKKKKAVALVQMYEYSVEYAAQYVGTDAQKVRKWLYESYTALPEGALFSQRRVQRNGRPYEPEEQEKPAFGLVIDLKDSNA